MKKTNAAKPGEKKLRVVFDAAAPFNGKNLNDVLLAGPASRENQDPKTTSSSRSGKEKPPSWASSGGLHSTSSTSPFASLWTSSSRGTGSSASSRRFLDPLGLASLVTVQAKIKLKTLSLWELLRTSEILGSGTRSSLPSETISTTWFDSPSFLALPHSKWPKELRPSHSLQIHHSRSRTESPPVDWQEVSFDLTNLCSYTKLVEPFVSFIKRCQFEAFGEEIQPVSVRTTGPTSLGPKELLAEVRRLGTDPEIQAKFHRKGMEWKFQPPSVPHFGGAHESLVRLTKVALYRTSDIEQAFYRFLTDEVLRTLLNEVAGLLNSRPLTYVCSDVRDGWAITPNDLMGKPPTVEVPAASYENALPA